MEGTISLSSVTILSATRLRGEELHHIHAGQIRYLPDFAFNRVILTDMLSGSIPSQPRSIAFRIRALMISYTTLSRRVGRRVIGRKDAHCKQQASFVN